MRLVRALQLLIATTAVLVVVLASPAQAQDPKLEIGTSLAGATIGLGDNDLSTFGVPTAGFNLLSPSVYATFFLGPHLGIEPQIGLVWATRNGDTSHFLSVGGQADYFLRGPRESSPYVFGAVAITDVSGGDTNPTSFGGGAGYRKVAGGRLVLRFDGRYAHFTDNRGSVIAFAVSIGGLFGR